MLKSQIKIDLPSAETQRSKGPLEWAKSLFGAELDLRSGQEELTVGAMTLVQGVVAGFQEAGINNAIIFIVDKKVVYQDNQDVDDDLHLILEAAQTGGVLDRPFQEMHLVLTHLEDGLHEIFDVRIRNQVMLGEDEMEIELTGRVESFRIQPGESAKGYSVRVKREADDADVDQWIRTFQQRAEVIAGALEKSLHGIGVHVSPARIQLIRPQAPQVKRFQNLEFGPDVQSPSYRPVPTHQRYGAYSDPFYYYYHDPYYDLTHFILLDHLYHDDSWHRPDVSVVEPTGGELFTGVDAGSYASDGLSWDDVSFSGTGLDVSEAVAESVIESTPADADWGGGDISEDVAAIDLGEASSDDGGGWFSSLFDGGGDTGEGGSSWSLCGSSDGDGGASCGSSCGSSCGGCGGCG